MTEPLSTHLGDDALNEYLDEALTAAARAEAEAHLARCPACSARLGRLRALFANLGDLPEAPLARDLAPGVTLAVRQHISQPASAGRPWLAPVFGLQLLVAAAAVGVAWPYVAAQAGRLWRQGPPTAAWLADLAARLERMAGGIAPPEQLWADWQRQALAGWYAIWPSVGEALPAQVLVTVAAGAGLVWVITNAWLLRQGPGGARRRTR